MNSISNSKNIDFNNYVFGFIGLGLIGGSIARAIRQFYPASKIIAFNPHYDSVKEALDDGVINEGYTIIDSHFSDADIIFLCAPVKKNAENLAAIRPFLKDNAILTDIGSTKKDIHDNVILQELSSHFIGGHPMTGSERTRYRNSKASLLENAYYILAPEIDAPKEAVDIMYSLVSSIKAIPLVVPYVQHDYAVAAISHVPHVISAALVNLVQSSDTPDGLLKAIAAGGFKDITRISSSSPLMWEQICLTNGHNISELLEKYIKALSAVKKEINSMNAEELEKFFTSAKDYRDSFSNLGSGPVKDIIVLNVDIPDKTGSLASVIDLLSKNSINIKNINIEHNREYEEGTLRIEFYKRSDLEKAADLLSEKSYSIH